MQILKTFSIKEEVKEVKEITTTQPIIQQSNDVAKAINNNTDLLDRLKDQNNAKAVVLNKVKDGTDLIIIEIKSLPSSSGSRRTNSFSGPFPQSTIKIPDFLENEPNQAIMPFGKISMVKREKGVFGDQVPSPATLTAITEDPPMVDF